MSHQAIRTAPDAPDFDEAADYDFGSAADPDYDEVSQARYDEGADPYYDESAQPDYDTDCTDPDAQNAPSQEYYKRSQK